MAFVFVCQHEVHRYSLNVGRIWAVLALLELLVTDSMRPLPDR